jgi:uncharacterized coiled-coil protein SlyX
MTASERLTALERPAAQHAKEVGGIRKLITIGMKMLNRNQEQINLLTGEVRALAAAQRRTEAALRGLIESLRAGNGHTKRKVNFQ